MEPLGPGDIDAAEQARVERVYARYHRSRRKQRAWAADNPGNIAMRQELLGAASELAADELAGSGGILDVGCGTGWWLAALASGGVESDRLYGVDVLPERVKAAQKRTSGASISEADARSLPYPDACFSLVTLFSTCSSLDSREDVSAVLSEAARVATEGGLVLTYEPRMSNPLNRHTLYLPTCELVTTGLVLERRQSITLLPFLARRLGRRAAGVYATISRVPMLRTHYLLAHRRPVRLPTDLRDV